MFCYAVLGCFDGAGCGMHLHAHSCQKLDKRLHKQTYSNNFFNLPCCIITSGHCQAAGGGAAEGEAALETQAV
jgi:hypothetical protein